MKKILILTAGKTGGHRSASNALKTALLSLDPSLDIIDYDSNCLFLGYKGEGGEQGYVTITTRFRVLWKLFFEFTSFFHTLSNFFLYQAIHHRFSLLLKESKPDIVISLHPCFVASARKVLSKFGNIPFYVVVLDPMKHSHLWRDKGADLTFLPTLETKDAFLRAGFCKDKLMQSGFPLSPLLSFSSGAKKQRKRLLFVNPSQRGLRATRKLIEAALLFDVDIDVVTGSDGHLKEYLEKHLPKREGLHIFGYVHDMNARLQQADILLTKAGPNIMFEAIAAGTPIIFTGHLLGQEEKNSLYAVKRGYGVVAETPKTLTFYLKKFLLEEERALSEMREKEKQCPDIYGAIKIAEVVIQKLKEERD